VLVKFAKSLGIVNIAFAHHILPGDQDDILVREDKTPNTLGAELVGVKPGNGGLSLEGILRAIKEQKIKAVL